MNGTLVISDPLEDRYAVLRLLEHWDHDRIRRSRVMVVGAGALGNEVLKNLTLIGVGCIVVVDFDRIEASNLTRSVLFRAADGGRLKAEVAAERIRDINPDLQVVPLACDITRDIGLGMFRRMDVVIGCLDNRMARLAVNLACRRSGRPWVDGGLYRQDGTVQVFTPDSDVCYACGLTQDDHDQLHQRSSCPPGFSPMAGRNPTTPMAAAVTAAVQVQEAVGLLFGLPIPSGRASVYSANPTRMFSMMRTSRPDCDAHQAYGSITSLPLGNDVTVTRFLDAVEEHVASPANAYLPQATAVRFVCDGCGQVDAVASGGGPVPQEPAVCPTCGGPRAATVFSMIGRRFRFPSMTLAELGVPPLDVIPVRSKGRLAFFELGADEARIFATQEQ